MSRTRRRAAIFLAASLIALASACSSKKDSGHGGGGGSGGEPAPTPCTSSRDCGGDERCDLHSERCVPKCTADNQCPRDTGTRCDDATGECIPARTCTHDYNCQSTESDAYCTDAAPCICVPDESVADGKKKGVCWRPAKTCEPCNSSLECGEGEFFEDQPAACRTYNLGGKDRAVCLPEVGNRCPAGMIQANASTYAGLDGLCVPQGGDCAAIHPCEDDGDCTQPGLPTCDPVQQICIPGCSFDFGIKESVGCAPGRVCNMTPKGSDPALLTSCETAPGFGLGSCSPPCASNEDCAAIDPTFVCRDDGGGARCRPTGCLSDLECGDAEDPFRGYCDPATRSCVSNVCRTGLDPRLGCDARQPFNDCIGGFKCVEGSTSGVGTCEKMNCIERGGAEVACPQGHFCSGEPYRDPITGKPTGRVVELPGVPVGECAPMELSAWCTEKDCSRAEDCLGRGPTDYADSPPVCTTRGMQYLSCFWGCESDVDCPARWSCTSLDYEFECGGGSPAQFCESHDDCAGGSRCVEPTVFGGPSDFHGFKPFKVCECTETNACGEGFSCNAGIATAGVVPGDPTYEKIQARYCTAAGSCGAKGSCEWFGVYNQALEQPRFFCGNAPKALAGTDVSCPSPEETAGGVKYRPGKSLSDRRICVSTSYCDPTYSYDPQTGDPQCTYYGAP